MSPFDPRLWLDVAQALLAPQDKVDQEARLRTCVNRSYYAALLYLVARIEAAKGPGTVPRDGRHGAIQRALKKTNANHLKKIQSALDTMREERNDADYQLDVRIHLPKLMLRPLL